MLRHRVVCLDDCVAALIITKYMMLLERRGPLGTGQKIYANQLEMK